MKGKQIYFSLPKLILIGLLVPTAKMWYYMDNPIEIGKNDVGGCDTKATSFDNIEKETSSVPANMRILIGGLTNSKRRLLAYNGFGGATTSNGCLVRLVPFLLDCQPLVSGKCNDVDAMRNWTFFGHKVIDN